ncbi:PrsW family intramembrane metalloprotease [Halorubrum sp. SY-15]|jgi:RsiW-degrading membrane proteinase PrsW (M82 family)|uniref:PrsW family intramembrane metalloprotease n=1 Tax=Halorubrum sp. SY-15 TaxID=3402277 RepID=UPI003EC0D111
MGSRSDPVERAADDGHDLYDVATWEQRTRLDGVAVALHWILTRSVKAIVVLLAAAILLGILASVGVGLLFDPAVAALVSLSAIPAFGLAAYVYVSDVTDGEPLSLLVVTFLLSVLTATFAAVFNSATRPFFAPLGFVGSVLFFFIVVGPVEESVKLLAVRLYAYVDDRFDAVIDGAVYGAIAGLGFAVIENLLYIAQTVELAELSFGLAALGAGDGITALRALAGPGHVVYSAFAGYYLGLAKFNPGQRGPIVIKGVVIAAAIHGLYNTLVGPATAVLGAALGLARLPALFVFVVAFQGAFGLLLVRKLRRYRDAYRTTRETTDRRVETTPSGVSQDIEAWTFDAVQPPAERAGDDADDARTAAPDDADADDAR